MPSSLAILDVDGTLTDTMRVDGKCFLAAVQQLWGFDELPSDWASFTHVTDAAILDAVFQERLGRAISEAERRDYREALLARLSAEHGADAHQFRAIDGAAELVRFLRSEPSGALALATGGWEATARFKLACAGIDIGDAPIASSDDARAREEIVEIAIARSKALHRCDRFERITLVGDAVWDVKAAARLGYPFVGIARGERAARLRAHGAETVVSDFLDRSALASLLSNAAIPVIAR